jgi:hypothetical protein
MAGVIPFWKPEPEAREQATMAPQLSDSGF